MNRQSKFIRVEFGSETVGGGRRIGSEKNHGGLCMAREDV